MAAKSPIQRILLVVDGTESAAQAAQYAADLARAAPAMLRAVAVVDTDTLRRLMSVKILASVEMKELEAEMVESARKQLDYVEQIARKARVPIETVLREGVCHSLVLAEQKASKSDVIVIGGFRSSRTKVDLVHRERQLIVDEAQCPVLIVR